jgi:hypothetical protein
MPVHDVEMKLISASRFRTPGLRLQTSHVGSQQ